MCYIENYKKLRKNLVNLKNFPSTDCKLKLVYMKLESLVIANQHVAVKSHRLCTHRPSHSKN